MHRRVAGNCSAEALLCVLLALLVFPCCGRAMDMRVQGDTLFMSGATK